MVPKTRATEALGIEHPIVQAPMAGGPSTPEPVEGVVEGAEAALRELAQ